MSRREGGAAELELLKAVAQAWHGHAGDSGSAAEFDVAAAACRKGANQSRPTRFRVEAARRQVAESQRWDFAQSLWDSYEIVTVSKKLESGLAAEDQNAVEGGAPVPPGGRRTKKESKRSLRNLLRIPSRKSGDDLDVTDRPSEEQEVI
ncbi:unnamed protein product [Spirodela intermedia]|uniref:Uncharacterized protein n=2 Tax=Spirodela intermedia TaxID=51605 RepID=A0A7I8JE33_SPIIN|nr:unnamed protein product [Spirodela intermedia]CAA6668015.1 unnamed protein product [Spirodela intermedia]CAA7404840.1 unnamed protein product [Spirodela intermedia]